MKRAGAACLTIVATLLSARLDAQRLAPAVLTSSTNLHRPPPPSTVLPKGPDHRWEGAAIGGIVTGLLFAYIAVGFCSDPDSNTSGGGCVLPAVEGLVIGAVPGVVIGGLVGSLVPKAPKSRFTHP
jgi:hypothetical protein